jgi:AcrR family transcriptional regulator
VGERVFIATIEMLTAKGYGALNFQEIATAAEVSRTTLYRRWPTKAELVLEAMSHALAERIKLPDTGSLAGDAAAALRQLAKMLASPFGAAVLASRIELQGSSPSDDWRGELWIRRFAEFWPLFERAKKRGELPEDFDVEAALGAAVGAMHYRIFIQAREIDDDWIDRVIAVITPAASGSGASVPTRNKAAPGRKTT